MSKHQLQFDQDQLLQLILDCVRQDIAANVDPMTKVSTRYGSMKAFRVLLAFIERRLKDDHGISIRLSDLDVAILKPWREATYTRFAGLLHKYLRNNP
ncbi:MAG TPA: hypothetical protein VEA44_03935 [Caulobacter sp.]|nr:hypothetical protein [Caulobacter sp.]